LSRLKAAHVTTVSEEVARPAPPPPAADRTAMLESRLAEAVADIARLRADVGQLRAAVAALQDALGVAPPGT